MSTVEQIERAEERRKRRVAFLFLAALLILLLGLIGRSWFVEPVEGDTDVLSQTEQRPAEGWVATARPPESTPGAGNAVTAAGDTDEGEADDGEVTDGDPPTAGSIATASGATEPTTTSGNPSQGNQGNEGHQGNAGGSGGNRGGGAGGGPGTNPPAEPQTFGIRGEVADLYPGFVGHLELTLTNPHRFRIVVTDLSVQVGTPTLDGAAVPTCAGYLTVDPWRGSRTIATLGSAPQPVTARFSADATDACQNVTYPLSYGGTAIRENQS